MHDLRLSEHGEHFMELHTSALGVKQLTKHPNKSFSIKIKLLGKVDKGLGI